MTWDALGRSGVQLAHPNLLRSKAGVTDYILVRKHFRSGVISARTLSFPGADTGSDHDLRVMTFHFRLKRISKPKHKRLKFCLEKPRDPNALETFQAMMSGKFASLTIMNNEDTDPVLSHQNSQERQPAAVPELPDDQPNQPLKQSHAEDNTEQIQSTNREDHR